ncbi:MAG: tetratricopeptide repeat protein [Sandaracinaceae bacterium]|nr:tetratricopeptide repeat protein [Sandaracinaceae bacterium]
MTRKPHAVLSAAAVLLWAVSALGCAASTPHVARATEEGGVSTGPYVSPYQYEHYLRGELALASGQPAQAAREFALARTGSADDAWLRARHAQALTDAGEWERAGRVLDDSLVRFPRSLELHLTRARWAEGQGREEAALAALIQAEEVSRGAPAGALAHAALLSRLGRDADAEAVLDRFLARSPHAHAYAARLELALRRAQLDVAVQVVRAWSEHPPRERAALRRVAALALEQGRPELTLSLLTAPTGPEERLLCLRAHAQTGRYAEAEAELALVRDQDVGGLEQRASLYLLVRRADVALELLGEIVARPEVATPAQALLIGACLLQRGQPADAAGWFARVPSDSTDGNAAREQLGRALRAAGLPALAAEVHVRAANGSER